jgi:hypothetical protein
MGCFLSREPAEERPIRSRIVKIDNEEWNYISINNVDVKATRISDGKDVYFNPKRDGAV